MNASYPKLFALAAILVGLLATAAPQAQAAAAPPTKPLISIAVQSQVPPGGQTQLTQPAIAEEGFTAMFSADVQGSAPLAFQWFLNGAAIDGATNAAYILQTLEGADE